MRNQESARTLFVVWSVTAVLLLLTALTGCSAAQHGDRGTADVSLMWGAVCSISALALYIQRDFKAVLLLLGALLILTIGGCAALPMPLQPETENNSNIAEGGFIVLAAVDTAQTMHMRRGTRCDHEADPIAAALYGGTHPKPGRVLLTNLALITVHTMVASWLDDEVEAHKTSDTAGLWYTGRLTFHAVSLIAESSAVASNAAHGCAL